MSGGETHSVKRHLDVDAERYDAQIRRFIPHYDDMLATGVELLAGATHCLFGCTVAPGFDFADFELAEGPELAARHPAHAARIARMVRRRA